jgi:hypothetical protein
MLDTDTRRRIDTARDILVGIENLTGDFTVADLERLCPGVSRDHLRRLLKEIKAAGQVSCIGRGPGAK